MKKIKCPECNSNAKFCELIDSEQSKEEIKDLHECSFCDSRFFVIYKIRFHTIIKVK